jgi:hypothetical protein
MLLSGFVFPVGQLPLWLQPFSWPLPSSWGMSGVWLPITGEASGYRIGIYWFAALALSFAWLALIYSMFRVVEKRVKVTGDLGAF